MRRHNDGSIGRVHIGSGPAALRYLLLPVLQRLRAEHPDIDLAVSTGNTADITERLSRNAVDIGFTGLPVDSALFEARAVRVMDMVAIMPADDRDIPSVVTPQDIAERSLIVTPQRSNHAHLARDWLRGAGLDIRPAMEIDDIEAIKQVVAAGLGVAIIPSEAISRGDPVAGLAVRPLHPPPTLTLGLICRRQTPHDPALTIVCDAIMTLAEEPSDPVVRAANPSSPPTAPGDPAADAALALFPDSPSPDSPAPIFLRSPDAADAHEVFFQF